VIHCVPSHLAHFSRFGILCHEKSGHPGIVTHRQTAKDIDKESQDKEWKVRKRTKEGRRQRQCFQVKTLKTEIGFLREKYLRQDLTFLETMLLTIKRSLNWTNKSLVQKLLCSIHTCSIRIKTCIQSYDPELQRQRC
jgi:hypothetical protein